MRIFRFYGLLVVVPALCGCQPGGGSAIKPPSVDPAGAAEAAIQAHDADGDGKLSRTELVGCPGLLVSISKYDTNGDRHLGEEEVSSRLASMYSGGVGLTIRQCSVLVGGRPLSGATVRLIPEEFLGGAVLTAEGVTDVNGQAQLAVDDAKLPADQRGLDAMQPGVYRVEITHPNRKIPKRYNSETTLGHEVHPGDRITAAFFALSK
ncbi:MAG: hypothetical protein MK171_04855 [Pirellulales bacterium]|mgnify:CR=1 FL=1|nr:hypothetical protein [Pirellulales bacterium]